MNQLKLRKLGRTGLKVFPLGFGGIPIQRITEAEAVKVIQRAAELGINFIDTARKYGDSEEKIGEALKGIDKKIYLATKTPADSKEEALQDINISLDKLGVEKIDLYQLHMVSDRETLKKRIGPDGALSGLKQAQKEGKIEHIGVTGHSDEVLIEALKTGEFSTVMFCYNFIENECEKGLIEYAKTNNIGLIAMKPLGGGRLDNASVALKYVLQQDGVVPIPGIESRAELEENVEIARGSWELTENEENIKQELKNKLGKVFCRRCDYCQPCPQEISISTVLRAESFINRMTMESLKKGGIYDKFQQAKECVECKKCVERCPYNLPIPELIKENVKIMDDYIHGGGDHL